MKFMRVERVGGSSGRRWMFRGVDMKEILWPFWAMNFASSKYGMMWPNASQGNTATCSFGLLVAMVVE